MKSKINWAMMSRKLRVIDVLEGLRKRAGMPMRNGRTDPAADIQSELARLNHELEVQRVELELRNEELQRTVSELNAFRDEFADRKRAGDELEQSLAQFQALFNQMTEGLVIFDPEGNLLDMNPAALAIHDCENVEKIRRHLDTLDETFELCDLEGHRLPTEKWPIGRVLRGETFNAYEVRVRNRHTGKIWYGSYGGTPVWGPEGQQLMSIVTLRDITAQKQSEAALRESEEKFRTMANGLPLNVWVHDAEGRLKFVNNTCREFFGLTDEQMRGGRWQKLLHREDGIVYMNEFFDCVRKRRPFHVQARVRRSDGQWRWLESWGNPLFSSSGTYLGIIGTSADITERKEAEEILRDHQKELESQVSARTAEIEKQYEKLEKLNQYIKDMAQHTIKAMENDRKAVSKEIHDGIGGSLAAVKMLLETRLMSSISPPPEGITSLEAIVGHLADTIKESKRISYQLRPRALDDFGLIAGLNEFIRDFKEFYPEIEIHPRIYLSPNTIPEEIKTAIYRIFQEALNNLGKHSRATSANVELIESVDQILLSVEDNGVGFEVATNMDAGKPLQGYGLMSMKERVEICGGTFRVESSPGKGTRLFASIPIHS